MFQQLETSHQIGQRQQTLVETLSQQLEIVQTIVPQLESEHEQLTQKYQQQSHKLHQTEQVVIELHRQLQLHATDSTTATDLAQIEIDPILAEILNPTSILQGRELCQQYLNIDFDRTTDTTDIQTIESSSPHRIALSRSDFHIDDLQLKNQSSTAQIATPASTGRDCSLDSIRPDKSHQTDHLSSQLAGRICR